MRINLTLAHSVTCATLMKAILSGGCLLFFRSYVVFCIAALLEPLVVRVLCVGFS